MVYVWGPAALGPLHICGSKVRDGLHLCRGDQPQPLTRISAQPQRLPPSAMVEIPTDGLGQSRIERLDSAPSQLPLQLAGVDRIALVMPGPVGDKGNEPAAAFGLR